ncbi:MULTISPECIES: hypothetical protein [Arthrobacter]|jgi:hypothetical protein|uniref:Uncharacterized protein n=1 Tax=Arthrobacter mangrovi TaxID=2966350 RepID=A0ABQ5MWJ1_9MICC|nr:hypothetical protein [Arthrobacter mangrovi]GLB68336.1 hypothetical protein AHIS1636_27780 [Arthrobacter mangrovi]
MGQKKSGAQRFMNITGKLRVIFGPAQKSGVDHPMTEENKELLKAREAEAEQWQTIRRADGSTYIVPKQQ